MKKIKTIKGTKKELVKVLENSYLEKGFVLQDIKIASNGKWSASVKNKSKTINQLLDEVYDLLSKQCGLITRLKTSLGSYFMEKDSLKKKSGEHDYRDAIKRVEEFMNTADANILKSIDKIDLWKKSRGHASNKTWELLQMIIINHL